jgi:hypothetical protein
VERNGDIRIYDSTEEAGSALESPDIESGEYVAAYDEMGNVFSIESASGGHASGLVLDIKPGLLKPTGKNAAEDLRMALVRRFMPQGRATTNSLRDLISAVVQASNTERAARLARSKAQGRFAMIAVVSLIAIITLAAAIGGVMGVELVIGAVFVFMMLLLQFFF